MNLAIPSEAFAVRADGVARIAAQHARDVDERARLPRESVDALRATGLLAMAVPVGLGGEGADLLDLSAVATILGRACSSTAMIFAMHQIQILCLARHARGDAAIEQVLRNVASEGSLIASVTTEAGIGGDTRSSGCAIAEDADGRVRLEKDAPVISYGEFADAFLVTARRDAEAAASDQVLVYCPAGDVRLHRTSEWDTLGFRGTCSPGFRFAATVPRANVLLDDFATISAETMLPVSHLLWSAVWLGIAGSALDRATEAVKRAARRAIGSTPPSALRLAELLAKESAFAGAVADATRTFAAEGDDGSRTTGIADAIVHNSLKVTSSETLIDIVSTAMVITGIGGYRLDSDLSLGRQLRDAFGTAVMVSNDRILANNAHLALARRGLRSAP